MRQVSIFSTLVLAAAGVCAQQGPDVRNLTLQESLALSIQQNLDLQIERLNPQLSLYDLSEAYGQYDPSFSWSGQRQHNEAGSRLLGGGFELPGEVQDSDSFRSSLGGLTPWGMTYSLQGGVSDTYGKSFNLATNGNVLENPFESSAGSVSIELRQPLLKNFWIDQTRLSIRVAKNRIKWSEQGLRQRLMTVITSTEQTYYNLIAARELVKAQETAVELASRLLEENRKRVEVGALAPLDEKQAEAQTASSKADLIEAEYLVSLQEHQLKSLISSEYSEWAKKTLVPAETLAAPQKLLNRQDSWSQGLSLRPELIQAKLDAERAGLQVKYARNQLLPQVDVFGSYGYNGSGIEFSDALGDVTSRDRPFHSFGGQIVMPLVNTSARNRFRSSQTQEQQAILALKRMEQQIMVQIDDDLARVESGYQRVQATRAAREYAEAALLAEQKKLESGKSTSFQVLQLQRDLTTARGSEIRALADYNRALAQLSLSEGTTLQRHNVDVDFR